MTDYERNDEDFDRLIHGSLDTDAPVDDTVQFVRDLQDMCLPAQPSPHRQRHLEAIRQSMAEPHRTPTTIGGRNPLVPVALPRRSARQLVSDVTGTATARAALVAATLMVSTGGMAAAGALPEPVQSAVAQSAGTVGIDLPRPQVAVADRYETGTGVPLAPSRPPGRPPPSPTRWSPHPGT